MAVLVKNVGPSEGVFKRDENKITFALVLDKEEMKGLQQDLYNMSKMKTSDGKSMRARSWKLVWGLTKEFGETPEEKEWVKDKPIDLQVKINNAEGL